MTHCFVRAMYALLGFAMLVSPSTQASGTPGFVPKPSSVYEGFVAIDGPRADVPVGALWIDGYGPHGEQATPDNLEVVRGLSGISINRDLELRLTAGLLGVLGIDPNLRRHFQARFTDLSVVKVKDVARLSGPAGEPRIIEALKAGSITITTDNGGGLGVSDGSVLGSLTATVDSDGRRAFTIEGRDMFVAFRVARSIESRSKPTLVAMAEEDAQLSGAVGKTLIIAKPDACRMNPENPCDTPIGWRLGAETVGGPSLAFSTDRRQTLAMPVSDERGGLYTKVEVEFLAPCKILKVHNCGTGWRAYVMLVGDRVEDVKAPKAPRW